MQAYAERLKGQGFEVAIQHHNQASDTEHITLLWKQGYRVFHLVNPLDDLLERRLRRTLTELGGQIVLSGTPMLLTPPEVLEAISVRAESHSWRASTSCNASEWVCC